MEHTPTCKMSGCDAPATHDDLCEEHAPEAPWRGAYRELMGRASSSEAPSLDLGALREQFHRIYRDEILGDAPPIPASLLTMPAPPTPAASEPPRLLPSPPLEFAQGRYQAGGYRLTEMRMQSRSTEEPTPDEAARENDGATTSE